MSPRQPTHDDTGGEDDAGPLGAYRTMRDFARTPEPAGPDPASVSATTGPRFVVQEHHATALHWDFRLERDGVLVSWAVPKGLPLHPDRDHLAVHTEDHPMDYLSFEGDIPAGEYGGGQVHLWDSGTYACEKWRDREIMVVLEGRRVRGRYVLFQTRGRDWMIHRMDPPEDPTRQLLPDDLRPAQPEPGPLPEDQDRWAFEVAWGGLRVALAVEGGRVRARTAGGTDVTGLLPELGPFGRAVGSVEVGLEAECVVLGGDGRPDPTVLDHRARLRSESARKRQAAQRPAVLLLADMLWLEGHPAGGLDHAERRRLLTELGLADPRWPVVPSHRGEGTALRRAAAAQGLPAVLARPVGPYTAPRWIAASDG